MHVLGVLTAVLGPTDVIVDPDVMEFYRRDHAPGMPAGQPVAVVRAASAAGVPLVARGAGSCPLRPPPWWG